MKKMYRGEIAPDELGRQDPVVGDDQPSTRKLAPTTGERFHVPVLRKAITYVFIIDLAPGFERRLDFVDLCLDRLKGAD
jgi:hypothetical protein